ncbi:MAG: heparinase II/III family protein [Candidatus Hydrogenedentes bacterium]|nr:heparinase II/III family protein [Candidatus Hydrogenedentota bacterium]
MRRLSAAFGWIIVISSVVDGAAEVVVERSVPAVIGWSELLDQSAANAELSDARAALAASAAKAAEAAIIRRAHSLAEVGTHRTWLDGRSEALEPEIKEQFALAMSDFAACNTLAKELPLLAARYRLTRDPVLRERIVAQLEEMASWSPLQRPGWTLYTPGNRLPPDGKDGNWLATGCGVRAIGDTLDLLPDESLSPELLDRLHALLESEIAGVVDDWETKRSWFIRSDNPHTNQWVLPTEGLVRACIILGIDNHRDAYALGVTNLMRALNAHGDRGEFEEGFGYAQFTVTSMLHAAHAMAVAGDRRAIDHPFLKNFPTWLVHHFQPGDMVINCFDAGGAFGAAENTRPFLSLTAMCTGDPVARWALQYYVGGASDDLAGLAARALPRVDPDAAPPLFAAYERAARVNWRSSWEGDATGVWVRGGHPLDQHDHQDRGHVNFIARGRPILIESGTPAYSHPQIMTHYSSGVGHNVLQLGTVEPDASSDTGKTVSHPGWQKRGAVAPIAVKQLNTSGGVVTVDATACYDDLTRWTRHVVWGANNLDVTDNVTLTEGKEQVILFRWHLGTEDDVEIVADGNRYIVTWPDATITLTGSAPLTVTQVKLPDNTLEGHDGNDDPKNHHTCIVVQTCSRLNTAYFTTVVRPHESTAESR